MSSKGGFFFEKDEPLKNEEKIPLIRKNEICMNIFFLLMFRYNVPVRRE